jgi:hypothetical protein
MQQPPRQGRPHAYGDLFGPAGGPGMGPGQFPEAALAAPAEAPSIPGQRTPDGQPQFHPGQPMGMPPGARTGGPMAPPRGPIAPPQPEEAKPERKGRIIVGVLVICIALLAAAFGGLILIDKLFNGSTFAVGDCVKQSDTAAVKADCGESNAFKVTAVVTNPEQCQDQTQPHVQQGTQYFCLGPATNTTGNESTGTPTPGGTPTAGPTATPTK